MVKVFLVRAGHWHNPSRTRKHEKLYVFFARFTSIEDPLNRENLPGECADDFTQIFTS
jgi:hypothetical protein